MTGAGAVTVLSTEGRSDQRHGGSRRLTVLHHLPENLVIQTVTHTEPAAARDEEAVAVHMDVAWRERVEEGIRSNQGGASPPSHETCAQLHDADDNSPPAKVHLLRFGSPPARPKGREKSPWEAWKRRQVDMTDESFPIIRVELLARHADNKSVENQLG